MENFVRERLTRAVSNALDTATALNGAAAVNRQVLPALPGSTPFPLPHPHMGKIVDFETQVAADDADTAICIPYHAANRRHPENH